MLGRDQIFVITLQHIRIDEHRFGDLFSDFNDGIQGRKRVLENHADFLAADALEFGFAGFG